MPADAYVFHAEGRGRNGIKRHRDVDQMKCSGVGNFLYFAAGINDVNKSKNGEQTINECTLQHPSDHLSP